MHLSCSSFLVSVNLVSPALADAIIPALLTKESVSVDLPWSTWAITDMFLMLHFRSMISRIWSTVKFTCNKTKQLSYWMIIKQIHAVLIYQNVPWSDEVWCHKTWFFLAQQNWGIKMNSKCSIYMIHNVQILNTCWRGYSSYHLVNLACKFFYYPQGLQKGSLKSLTSTDMFEILSSFVNSTFHNENLLNCKYYRHWA